MSISKNNLAKSQYSDVVYFMDQVQQRTYPAGEYIPSTAKVSLFRLDLIRSEMKDKNELFDSLLRDNAVGVLDGMLDVLYVTYGALATWGLGSSLDGVEDRVVDLSKPQGVLMTYASSMNLVDALTAMYADLEVATRHEMEKRIEDHLVEIVDTIFLYAERMNFNIKDAFAEVHASNMSKLCDTHPKAVDTVMKYKAEDIDTYIHQAGEYYVVRRDSDDKVLKGVDFFEPNLAKFVTA